MLNPRRGGGVEFFSDGCLAGDETGTIVFAGEYAEFAAAGGVATERARGVMVPGFFDAHIHVPQHPIRGRFVEGVEENPEGGRLLAGLNRNVFPTEANPTSAVRP